MNLTYNVQGGSPILKTHKVIPGRYTIFVNEDAGSGSQLSVHINSDTQIICERSTYFSYNDWSGGHCAEEFAPQAYEVSRFQDLTWRDLVGEAPYYVP